MDVEDDLVDLRICDEFIDDNSVDEDLHFYHRKNNNRIVSDDDEYKEEEEEETVYKIPNSGNAIKNTKSNVIDNMPDDMRVIYSTDEYEWNHCKLPTGSIYEFSNEKHL